MTTTKTTVFELPIPPLGTTGTADGYGTLLQTAENNIIAKTVPRFVTYTATATAKDVVYMTAAGTAARAKADAVGTVYAIGFATETKTAAACIIQTAGVITITGKTFTPGLPVFISPTTAGDCTQTAPTTNGHQAQMVGIALTATDVEINLGPVVEVATGVVDVAAGKTVTLSKTMTITCADDTAEVTLPAGATTLASLAGAETLTNKAITKRVKVLPYNDATVTVGETSDYNTDLADIFYCGTPASSHGINQNTNFGPPGGTPTPGQQIEFMLYFAAAKDITWDTVFAARGVTPPGAASGGTGKYVRVLFQWNDLATKWDCIASATEA